MAYAMKGSPMQRNFGIGVANATGISGLTTKSSPMNWAWLVGVVKAAATKVGSVAAGIGSKVVGGASWLTGGSKTMLGKALGKGAAKLKGIAATKGKAFTDIVGKKAVKDASGKIVKEAVKGKGFKAAGKEAIKKFKEGKIGKFAKEALDPKEMAKGALSSAVMGMGRQTDDGQQPAAPNLAADFSTGLSASGRPEQRDNIAGASGLTYKYSPIKNRFRGGADAKKSKVVTTRGKNTITKSKDGKTSTYTATNTIKNKDGSKTVTYTNKLGNKITETYKKISNKSGREAVSEMTSEAAKNIY